MLTSSAAVPTAASEVAAATMTRKRSEKERGAGGGVVVIRAPSWRYRSTQVADGDVTPDAAQRFAGAVRPAVHGAHGVRVAVATGLFGDRAIARLDAERVGEPAGCEREGVPEAVRRLGEVLGDEPGRRVAVVARGDRAVARLHPAV